MIVSRIRDEHLMAKTSRLSAGFIFLLICLSIFILIGCQERSGSFEVASEADPERRHGIGPDEVESLKARSAAHDANATIELATYYGRLRADVAADDNFHYRVQYYLLYSLQSSSALGVQLAVQQLGEVPHEMAMPHCASAEKALHDWRENFDLYNELQKPPASIELLEQTELIHRQVCQY